MPRLSEILAVLSVSSDTVGIISGAIEYTVESFSCPITDSLHGSCRIAINKKQKKKLRVQVVPGTVSFLVRVWFGVGCVCGGGGNGTGAGAFAVWQI